MADDNPNEPPATSTDTGESGTRPDSRTDVVLELDGVFAALAHPRRRYLLYTLVDGIEEETLTELATKIAAWEQDKALDDVGEGERRSVHVALYHSHVPKLADLGIVDYREGSDVLVRAVNADQVRAVLDGAGAELDSRQETHASETDATESN